MMLSRIVLLLVSFAIFSVAFCEIKNTNVNRKIELKSHVATISSEITISGVSPNHRDYKIALPSQERDYLSYLSVKSGSTELDVKLLEIRDEYSIYSVELPGKSNSLSIEIFLALVGALIPFPREIAQLDDQFVRFYNSHYFYSPYETENQKTVINLASAQIDDFSKLQPITKSRDKIVMGGYSNIGPLSFSDFSVHFKNNAPFATATSVIREIEVSHWGNIAFEEVYELEHTGAKLRGGFSRIDHQMRRQSYGSFFDTLKAKIPVEAFGIYYRDQIGNISTSKVETMDSFTEFEIQPRFPMFGGWKTTWYQGYNVPPQVMLNTDGHRYELTTDFSIPFEKVVVKDLTVKVILPEGAKNIKLKLPFTIEQSESRRFTYLDSSLLGGRPVVILHMNNVVEYHNKPFTVTYEFNKLLMLQEPLLLVGFFLGFYIICMIFVRINFRLEQSKNQKLQSKND